MRWSTSVLAFDIASWVHPAHAARLSWGSGTDFVGLKSTDGSSRQVPLSGAFPTVGPRGRVANCGVGCESIMSAPMPLFGPAPDKGIHALELALVIKMNVGEGYHEHLCKYCK